MTRRGESMRIPDHRLDAVIARLTLAALAFVAVLAAMLLGPAGLVLLGLALVLACTMGMLNDDTPTAGTAVLQACMASESAGERAARAAERDGLHVSLRRYRRL